MRLATALAVAAVLLISVPSARAQSFDDLGADAVPMQAGAVEVRGKVATVSAESGAVLREYTGLLVRGYSEDDAVRGEVRFLGEGGAWGPWQPLNIVPSATTPDFVAGFRDEATVRDERFEVRFASDENAPVLLNGAATFDNRDDVDAREPLEALTPHVVPLGVSTTIPTPTLIRRSAWGARPFSGTPSPLARPNYLYLTFHHAAGYSADTRGEGIVQMRRIQDLHQDNRGWSDIGYQFVVDRAGNLYQGRPFMDESQSLADVPRLAMGAHAGGANTGNIGLSILGCYHPPEGVTCEQEITPEAFNSVVQMFTWLAANYGLTGSDIRGHRDFGSTACPGNNNYALLDEIRAQVDAALLGGPEFGAFPNPFTSSTTVRYYLGADPFNVHVAVYDALGREVAVLMDERSPQGERWYNIPLDASNLASGTYFVRMTSDDFRGTAIDETVSIVRVR
jgi:hypothetical protein